MNSEKSIFNLIIEAIEELSKESSLPFSRIDIINRISLKKEDINPDSVNPIVQAITQNLKGGASGYTNKNILKSVARGQFVLFDNRELIQVSIKNHDVNANKEINLKHEKQTFPNEDSIRNHIILQLKRILPTTLVTIEKEIGIDYVLPNKTSLNHKSDILITHKLTEKQVSIEIKYKSAVTDQFKCRAYDMLHMKNTHGSNILGVLIFVKSNTGISIERAKQISYPYDICIGFYEKDINCWDVNSFKSQIMKFFSDK